MQPREGPDCAQPAAEVTLQRAEGANPGAVQPAERAVDVVVSPEVTPAPADPAADPAAVEAGAVLDAEGGALPGRASLLGRGVASSPAMGAASGAPAKIDAPDNTERRYPERRNRRSWKDRYADMAAALQVPEDAPQRRCAAMEPREYGLHISVQKARTRWGDAAEAAIEKELRQFVDYGVWRGVKPGELTQKELKSAIRTLMFLKEKFRADGSFEKLKARLVANGSQQVREIFDTLSSQTAKQRSIMIVAGIAAREERDVVTSDIIGT